MRCLNRGSIRLWTTISIGLMAALWGIYSCTPNSSTSSGGQSGSGSTGNFDGTWLVGVAPAQSTMFQSVASTSGTTLNNTTVTITVTDVKGVPASPNATVFITCSNGAFGFRPGSSGYDYGQPITTDNRVLNNGRAFIDFYAGFLQGTASINATFQGSTGTASITILPTPTTPTPTPTTTKTAS
jgi:hypothetical protein